MITGKSKRTEIDIRIAVRVLSPVGGLLKVDIRFNRAMVYLNLLGLDFW